MPIETGDTLALRRPFPAAVRKSLRRAGLCALILFLSLFLGRGTAQAAQSAPSTAKQKSASQTVRKSQKTAKTVRKAKTANKKKRAETVQRDLAAKAVSIDRRSEEKSRLQRELDVRAAAIEERAEENFLSDLPDWESDPDVGPRGLVGTSPVFDWFGKTGPNLAEQPQGILDRVLDGVRLSDGGDLLSGTAAPFLSPVHGSCYISDEYGIRRNPFRKKRKQFHNGLDIAGPFRTPIVATADGVVVTSLAKRGYGNVVWLDNGNGYTTGFAHLSKRVVKPGQFVSRGTVIGYMGRTGRATGTHLHYMVKYNDCFVDPMAFLDVETLAAFAAASPWQREVAAKSSPAPADSEAAARLTGLISRSLFALAPAESAEETFRFLPESGSASPRNYRIAEWRGVREGPLASEPADASAGMSSEPENRGTL